MRTIKPNTHYSTKSGVTLLVTKVDAEGVWACSKNYIPEEAKPDWDLDGKYRKDGPPGFYDIGDPVRVKGTRFRADPDSPTFDWANCTEKQSQRRARKKV